MSKSTPYLLLFFVLAFVMHRQFPSADAQETVQLKQEVPDKRIVNCLLQGHIRKLGSTIYQAPPKPVQIPAIDCEIRGGDFLVFDRASYASTMSHWLGLAKGGDVNAQIYLGEVFERGMGRDPDYAQAVSWYSKAAESGSPVAQISLAQMYEKGLGVEQNQKEAERLYTLAFDTGDATSVALDPDSLGDPADRIQRLEQNLRKTRDEAEALSAQLAASQQNLSRAESELQMQKTEEQRLADELEAAQSQYEAATTDREALSAARANIDVHNANLEEQEFAIDSLSEEIERNRREIAAYQQQLVRIEELEAELQEQSVQYATTNKELRETRVALAESNNQMLEQQRAFEDERRNLEAARASLAQQSGSTAEARQELQRQLDDRESRLSAQEAELANMSATVDQYQTDSLELQAHLTELSDQNQELLQSQADARRLQEESLRLKSVLAETEQQLGTMQARAAKGDKLDKMVIELDRVKKEAAGYKGRIDKLEKTQESLADLAGPTIQVIEPVAFNTRGNSDIVVKTVEHQQIVGKVSAPAGILTLTVNQQITPVNASNVFQSSVQLTGEKTLVQIAAIDNQGKRTEQLFNFVNKEITTPLGTVNIPNIPFGKFHALLIGNEEYEDLPDLVTPKEDIHAIDKILRERYGFKTTVVEDGSREEIMDVMYEMLGDLTSEDNLLIYYAGHGEYVTDTNRGVWLPIDANPSSPANWITNVEITDYLKQIRARQIVVIADSCYSGALTRSALINLRPGLTDEEYEAHLKKMVQVQARVVLTSGGLAPVLDSANPGAQHSIFATALIEVLQQNNAVLSAQDLGRTIAAKVSLAASRVGYDQEPQYAPMNHANHQGGDFFFVPERM